MPDVVMPRLSDSMEEGTILKWLRSSGDQIKRGDELVEIETDKATMTYEADADGVLEIVAGVGDTLAIGAVIARLSSDGEVAVLPAEPAPPKPPAPAPAPAPQAPVVAAARERIKASPVAKRIARELGVELTGIAGSGPGGRIVRADVENTPPAPVTAVAPVVAVNVGESPTAKGTTTTVELSKTQQLVARRMASSKATVPDFTLSSEIDMQRCVELRKRLRAIGAQGAVVPSYNDMVVKAAALALREFPRANGSYKDGQFELYSRVNVGVAVAAQDTLVVPTIFDADLLPLNELATQTRTAAEQVRARTITPPQLSGATFTVSNLGMFGVSNFTAIINAPQAAILAVGEIKPTPVAIDGAVEIRHVMKVTLSCDHRILYGADAAQFLARIRTLLSEPLALLS